ncbi:MmgE/PrpD family protein [Bacillus sp. EB600]|uniref:MmgE/PrpD family protein n=1 Tax=Bacillus sp. EB600 TaxID=2806345 RepID=UPI00210A2464|nr:MmgE/PrpD family protein [Bacillus sp. EB600]MCQ6279595.1 hypothetical protein [Bacillus sp. EB600]
MKIASDLTHYHQCRLNFINEYGEVKLQREGRGPKGTPQNPMSIEEVGDKFRSLVKFKLDQGKIQEYLSRIDNLEEEKDIRWLVDSFD